MKKRHLQILLTISIFFMCAFNVFAHCEVPCGIYDDQARIRLIDEHITTIEKAMKEMAKLQHEKPFNYNQVIRWVMNKETHATEIQHIVSQYFMTQRIKPDTPKYQEKLTCLHQMLVKAMHCKQTDEPANAAALRELLKKFSSLYFSDMKK